MHILSIAAGDRARSSKWHVYCAERDKQHVRTCPSSVLAGCPLASLEEKSNEGMNEYAKTRHSLLGRFCFEDFIAFIVSQNSMNINKPYPIFKHRRNSLSFKGANMGQSTWTLESSLKYDPRFHINISSYFLPSKTL